MKKKLLIASLLVAMLCASLFYLTNRKERIDPRQEITLLDGRKITFGDLQGKKLMVLFWATSCTTCMQEIPKLEKIKASREDIEFLAIAMQYDEINKINKYASNKKYLTFAYDTDGTLANIFDHVKFTPTSFIIDKEGHVEQKFIGTAGNL